MSKAKQEYWSDVTTKIYTELGLDGQYICVWSADEIIVDGDFDADDLEKIARIVKEARENEPK